MVLYELISSVFNIKVVNEWRYILIFKFGKIMFESLLIVMNKLYRNLRLDLKYVCVNINIFI